MSSFTHIANKVTEIERITKNLHEPHYSEVLQYYWRLHVSPYITMKLGMRPAGNGDLVVFTGARLEDADVSAVGLLKRPRVLLHVIVHSVPEKLQLVLGHGANLHAGNTRKLQEKKWYQ
jgi:hypothetical protein